jgi:hypothetical protein
MYSFLNILASFFFFVISVSGLIIRNRCWYNPLVLKMETVRFYEKSVSTFDSKCCRNQQDLHLIKMDFKNLRNFKFVVLPASSCGIHVCLFLLYETVGLVMESEPLDFCISVVKITFTCMYNLLRPKTRIKSMCRHHDCLYIWLCVSVVYFW